MVAAADTVQCVPQSGSKRPSKLLFLLPAAIAACLVFAFIMFSDKTVTLTALSSSSPNFKPGTSVNINQLDLPKNRHVSFRTADGSVIELKGPCSIKFYAVNSISMDEGMSNVRLSANSKNFEVSTSHGVITDLGTAFGVSVSELSSEVHVYDGKVLVTTDSDKKTLEKGQSIQFKKTEFKAIDFNNNILEDKPDLLFLGERELRPGEQMELQMDSGGRELKAQVSMKFEKDKGLQYKIIARSGEKKVFESDVHGASDQFEIKIPASEGELILEMKVVKGAVVNGIVNLKDLSLQTEGFHPYEGESLVQAGSYWRYLYTSDPPSEWMGNDFMDNFWKSGQGALGYGDHDLKTKIGSNDLRKTISRIYLRKEFDIKGIELNSLKKLHLNLLADDGAVIYMNGREIVRYNIPEGPVSPETRAIKRATGNSGEMIYRNFNVPSTSLVMGKNVICVILYQIEGKSSDMRFDLKVSAF